MSHSWNYGHEKLHLAVNALATGDSPLADRLMNACIPALWSIQQENLPPDLWDRFTDVKEVLFPLHGAQAEHIRQISTEWLRHSAGEIVSLYDSICRRMPR